MEVTISKDIRQQKTTSILIGLCVTFAILFAAFEMTQSNEMEIDNDTIIDGMVPVEEDMMPITVQEQPQMVAPVVNNNAQPELLQIIDDDIKIEDIKIETSEENNQVIVSTNVTGVSHFVASAAPGPVVDYVEDEVIHDVVEKMAEFPGGEAACYKWLSEHIKYPVSCQEAAIQGRVFVSFVVNKDGSIVDIRIMRSPDDRLSKEAERVIKLMPKWKPARQGNKTVRSRFNLPVLFKLL